MRERRWMCLWQRRDPMQKDAQDAVDSGLNLLRRAGESSLDHGPGERLAERQQHVGDNGRWNVAAN